jgi:hypothetical protein
MGLNASSNYLQEYKKGGVMRILFERRIRVFSS